jgi:superfamily II DNA/RNA helicase
MMGNVEAGTKNQIVNLDSKKQTWESMGIPQKMIDNLNTLSFNKPSII